MDSYENVPPTKTKRAMENHHFEYEIHLQIVGLSIVIRWFQGGLEFTSSSPEYPPKNFANNQPARVLSATAQHRSF